HAGDATHTQCSTAARVAVHLRQDDARERYVLVEALRNTHRFLADHRVDDEEHFRRIRRLADALQLLHQRIVDLQTTRRVQDQRAMPAARRRLECGLRELADVLFRAVRINRNVDLLPQRLELIDRRRALYVQRRHHRLTTLALQPLRQLRGSRRLTRPLQTRQQNHRRPDRRDANALGPLAQQRDQLVVDDLDDLLPRLHRFEHLLAERALLDLREEVLRKLEIDVRLEQHAPNLAQSLADHR